MKGHDKKARQSQRGSGWIPSVLGLIDQNKPGTVEIGNGMKPEHCHEKI